MPVNDETRQGYMAVNDELARKGLRVLATARKDFKPSDFDPDGEAKVTYQVVLNN